MRLRTPPGEASAESRAKRRTRFWCLLALLGFLFGPAFTWAQGASITLAWEPNQEADLAGYRVYYGRASGVYEQSLDVGKITRVTVSGLESGTRYYFVVTATDLYGNESRPSEEVSWVAGSRVPVPDALLIFGNHPNPFAARTRIRFNVPQRGLVKVEILDIRGRRVRSLVNTSLPAGSHECTWDGRDENGLPVPSGTYMVVVRGKSAVAARSLTVLRMSPQ